MNADIEVLIEGAVTMESDGCFHISLYTTTSTQIKPNKDT